MVIHPKSALKTVEGEPQNLQTAHAQQLQAQSPDTIPDPAFVAKQAVQAKPAEHKATAMDVKPAADARPAVEM
jgi:hypothetical protein